MIHTALSVFNTIFGFFARHPVIFKLIVIVGLFSVTRAWLVRLLDLERDRRLQLIHLLYYGPFLVLLILMTSYYLAGGR
jgi:uncharacterized membrane protein (DUF373 family)